MIDRYLLRYFLAVVDQGNFSKAAAANRVSQPTLSVGIAKLERTVGAPLFNRTNRRVELTEVGARLVGHARQIETAFGAAEAIGHDVEQSPLLRFGVLSSLPSTWLEVAIRDARRQAPAERLEIVEASQKDLISLLGRGRIDAAVAVAPEESAPRRLLFTEGYAVAVGASHRLGKATSVRAEDLAGETMIVRRHCEVLTQTSRHFTQRGVRPFMAARTTSDDRALAYVRAGLGVTVMPRCFASPGVAMLDLAGFNVDRRIAVLMSGDSAPRVERTTAYQIVSELYARQGGQPNVFRD